jgi:uncharacterized repeat protein (TIGR03943 family)
MKRAFNAQAIVLIAVGLFIYSRLSGGAIFFYINERFITLAWLGALGLLLVGLIALLGPGQAAAACCHHEQGHDDSCDHRDGAEVHHHTAVSGWRLLILFVPVALGILVTPQPLTTAAMSNRDLSLGAWSDGLGGGHALATVPPEQRNILDWLRLFQAEPNASAFDNQEVRLTGFVYREDSYDAGTFMIGRFIIIHCVADASPAGLLVRWPDAVSLPDDQWVEVQGRLKAGEFDGRAMPILWAESVNAIQPPAQPYLYR